MPCRAEVRRRSNFRPRGEAVDTAAAGALSELLVAGDLLLRGYHVYRNVSASGPCDLIATKGDKLIRVEVKSGFRGPTGTLHFATVRPHYVFDVLAVVERDNSVVYLDREKQSIAV